MITGLASLGAIYSITTPLSGSLDRDNYEPEGCDFNLRKIQIVDLLECVLIFGVMFGLVLWAALKSTPASKVTDQNFSPVATPVVSDPEEKTNHL